MIYHAPSYSRKLILSFIGFLLSLPSFSQELKNALRFQINWENEYVFLLSNKPVWTPSGTHHIIEYDGVIYEFDCNEPNFVYADMPSLIDSVGEEDTYSLVFDGKTVIAKCQTEKALSVYDTSGRCLIHKSILEGGTQISLESLPSDVYIVKFGDKMIKCQVK